MLISAADVFRTRQVVSDLTAYVSSAGRGAFCRAVSEEDPDGFLDRILYAQGGRFLFPRDETHHGEVMLAAALPDEDYPAFTCATAMLLLDRISGGAAEDDLFWNWEAFSDHYRLADPPVRAVLMNGFRLSAEMGRASLAEMPDPTDCLSNPPEEVLVLLRKAGENGMADAIETGADATTAARFLTILAQGEPTQTQLVGLRLLYERPASVAPDEPETAPLIPWKL